jgi:hypothetical protein
LVSEKLFKINGLHVLAGVLGGFDALVPHLASAVE